MLFGMHPLLAYAVVGFGAAAYSPAKYGILTEYLPHHKLVIANGWIEGLTVASIILGTLLGGVLVSETVSGNLLSIDIPRIETGFDTAPEIAIMLIVAFYAIAAIFNLYIPRTGVDHRPPSTNPVFLIREFAHCVRLLWQDKLGQISLATTTLFWGAGATLQFIVLKWAETALGYTLSQATVLQGICAVGIAFGAVIAAKFIPLNRAVSVVPVGILMGLIVIAMVFARNVTVAIPLMVLIGALAGFFRRAHERAPAAPRTHPDGGRTFDRRAEFQRELEHPGDARCLCAPHLAQSFHLHGDRAVRGARRHHHGAGTPAASEQPAQRPAAEHSFGWVSLAGSAGVIGCYSGKYWTHAMASSTLEP
jgi:MFS family permease